MPSFRKEILAYVNTHHITTSDLPRHSRPRRLRVGSLRVAKLEFNQMIHNSDNSWAFGGQSDDSSLSQANYVPHIPYNSSHPNFISVYPIRIYHQILVKLDISKMLWLLHLACYRFCMFHSKQGIRRKSFQKFIDNVLRDLHFSCTYVDDIFIISSLDDIFITSSSMEEHVQQVHLIFEFILKFGIIINPSKCGLTGIFSSPSKLTSVSNFP